METTAARRGVPPLRKRANEPDEFDAERVEYARELWASQDAALRMRDRQIEENIRMLAGQQWTVWSDMAGRFVDVAQLMSADDVRWRQRPVVNKLLEWFILTHARLTENPPVVTFQPASGDREDAQLAEVMDTIFKAEWERIGMIEVIDRLVLWLIVAGRVYLKTRIDPRGGELVPWRGPAILAVTSVAGDGAAIGENGLPVEVFVPDAAYDRKGRPVTVAFEDQDGVGYHDPEGTAPHAERRGALAVDVIPCSEVRGEWGEQTPWHQKRWHMHRSYVSRDTVLDTWGVDVPATSSAETADISRILMGAGFFGAASTGGAPGAGGAEAAQALDYVTLYELWEAPSAANGTEETATSPGGRLLIVAGDTVLHDSVRPARYAHTSPIRCFDFVGLPGRPSGTSPQESLNPIQRAYNRVTAQILQHAALCADPKPLIHISAGIEEGEWTNEPGTGFVVNTEPGVAPVTYIVPPPLSADVYRVQEMLDMSLTRMGNVDGARGSTPQRGNSGELIKELRYNSDRPIASTARRMVLELARMVKDWIAMLPLVLDEDDVIAYAGDDQMVRTVSVSPKLFEQGSVHVVPDIESMLPEGRGERQARIERMWQQGAFGNPQDPKAISAFFSFSRFPHMGRDMRPGGIHRVTAEQENARLVRGEQANELPVYEWYDHAVHLSVLEEWMASPEWQRMEDDVQQQALLHREAHKQAIAAAQQQAMAEQARQMAMASSLSQAASATAPQALPSAPVGAGSGGVALA